MLSPRERFEKIPRGLYSDLLYYTLEALVEAVEPEDTDATIRKLQEECNELRETKARIANGAWKHRQEIGRLCAKRDEAQAEIERLRHELSAAADCTYEYRQKIMGLEAAIRGYESRFRPCGDCTTDAALGRLVRGMRPRSKLYRDPSRVCNLPWWGLASLPYVCKRTDDPAEALRSIQEVGDG